MPNIDVTRYKGLTEAEVAHRLQVDGANLLPLYARKSWWSMSLAIITEPMFLLLLIAGGIYLLLGDKGESLFLLGFLVLVIGITLVQSHKTERALEALRDLSAPRALVIRDGVEHSVLGQAVVRDDLLVLREGDRIAADAVLLEGQISVDESLLTGESVPVLKQSAPHAASTPLTEQLSASAMVFASTVVTKGIALASVHGVGSQTKVGRIGVSLKQPIDHRSALQKSINYIIRQLTLLGIFLASSQILLSWLWNDQPFLESLLGGIALAMAILPEELSVILTVFLALGAWRLSQKNVLTRRISAVESLGGISVLAVDKTGTLTHNRMQVAELVQGDDSFVQQGATTLPESFHALVEYAMLATPQDPFDPMEKAIQQFGHHWLAGTEHVHDSERPAFDYALSPAILAMTRVFSNDRPNDYRLATKGSPEAIIDLCHLPIERSVAIHQQVERMAAKGLRVLGVAQGVWQGQVWPASQHDFDFTFLGLIGFIDPPREDIADALAECRSAGIRVVMMTGDHPMTACAIAQQVGLTDRPLQVITGAEMHTLSDEVLGQRLREVDICARLQPEQKLRLVQMFQQQGEVVAMTGDGVNDAPALNTADVGIAMGQRGTDVAREAAALVLLDDRFTSIVAAIRQGRRIYDNIDSVTRFVFAVHLTIILLVLLPSVWQWAVLLLPVHIVLLQLVIDPACSIVFEAEPASEDVMRRPPRPVTASPFSRQNLLNALIQGAGFSIILLLGYQWLLAHGNDTIEARESVFIALVLGVFLLIWANRKRADGASVHWITRRNPWLLVLFVMTLFGLILTFHVPFLSQVMGFMDFSPHQLKQVLCFLLVLTLWLALWGGAIRWYAKRKLVA